jgi:branched-chain amino acid aminotransferase
VNSTTAIVGTQLVPLEHAAIDVRAQGFNYGASVFEGIRGYRTRDGNVAVFRLADHLERLRRSGAVVGITLPATTLELSELMCAVVRENGFREDIYLRPIAYKGVPTSLGISLDDAPDEFVAYTFALGEYLPRERPLRVCVSAWTRISDNAVPARCKIGGSYINPALAKTEAVQRGFDECLMLTSHGTVAEGTTSNLFLLEGEKLVTPASTEDILIGITRNTVKELATKELGLVVEERPVDRSEIYQSDEAFLCGTGAEVAAIGEIDGRAIGSGAIGAVTARIQSLYARAVRGELPGYGHWLTPVYSEPAEEPQVAPVSERLSA